MEASVVLQHDFYECINEMKNPKFFIGLRESEGKTNFVDLTTTDGIVFAAGDSGLVSNYDRNKRSLHVHKNDVDTEFFAPNVAYGPVHDTTITTLAISTTGYTIASGDTKGLIRISRAGTGEKLKEFNEHKLDVQKIRFFPSGLVLLSAGMDLTVRVWSLDFGECVRTFKGHRMSVTDIAIIDVGREVLSCSKDGSIIKWSCGTGNEERRWSPAAGDCTSLALASSDIVGYRFGVTCSLNKVFVYSLETNEQIACLEVPSEPTACCFDSGNPEIIWVGDDRGHVAVYDVQDRKRVHYFETTRGAVTHMESNCYGIFVSYKDGTLACYSRDFNRRSPVYEFIGPDCDPVYDFAMRNNELYTACRDRLIRRYVLPPFGSA